MRYGLAPTCSLYPCCLPGASWIPTVHWFCVTLALFHVKQQGKPTAFLSSARTNTETRLHKLCHILAVGDVSSSCVSPLCNSSIRRSDFAVFRQAFLQKGRHPRAAAPCTVPPTRAVRATAPSFFARHGKPAQGAQKSPRARQFSPQRPVFALPLCPLPFPPLCAPATLPVVAADAPVPCLPLHHMASPACIARLCTRTIMPA